MQLTNNKYQEAKILLKESTFLYLSIYFFTFFKFLSGFFVARFLGPSLYGLRTLFGLILDYSYFSHLGTYDAMRREIPYFRGRNDHEHAVRIQDNVFAANLILSIVVAVGAALAILLMRGRQADQIYIDFCVFFAISFFLDKVSYYYRTVLTVDKRSGVLSQTRLLEGFTYSIGCIYFTYYYSLRGLFVGLILSSLIVLAFLYAHVRAVPRLRLSAGILFGLVKVGFPIMLIALMFLGMRSIDRIIIASLLDNEQLGYFSVATIVSGLIYFSIGDVVSTVFGPRIMEKIGASDNYTSVKPFLTEPTILIAFGLPFLIGSLYLGIQLPIYYWLPEYLPAVEVIQFLCLGAFFMTISIIPFLMCVAINRQVAVVLIVFSACLIDAVLSYLFIAGGTGISGVAIGSSIAYFILSVTSLGYMLLQFKFDLKSSFVSLLLVYSPFLYMVVLLLAVDRITLPAENPLVQLLYSSCIRLVLFFAAYSVIFLGVRKHIAFKKLFGSLPVFVGKARR